MKLQHNLPFNLNIFHHSGEERLLAEHVPLKLNRYGANLVEVSRCMEN